MSANKDISLNIHANKTVWHRWKETVSSEVETYPANLKAWKSLVGSSLANYWKKGRGLLEHHQCTSICAVVPIALVVIAQPPSAGIPRITPSTVIKSSQRISLNFLLIGVAIKIRIVVLQPCQGLALWR